MAITTKEKCLLAGVFSLCNIVFMVLAFGIAFWAKEAVEPNLLVPTPLPVVKDLIKSWSAVPFVSLEVRNGECEDGEEDVFTRKWLGTERGCETNEGASAAPRDTWKDNGNKLADCTEVEAVDSIEMGAVT